MKASGIRQALEADWPELRSMLTAQDEDPVGGGLSYLQMAAIARFLAIKVRARDTTHFGTFFEAVERCLIEGDDEAVTLVMAGLLEDLQNSNVTELDNHVWLQYLRPTTRRAWQAVEDFWNGDVNAIARFDARQSGEGPERRLLG